MFPSANPVTVPGVSGEEATVQSTNTQFEYETVEQLQEALKLQYGQVGEHLRCICGKGKIAVFSGTSDKGPSEIRTTSLQRTLVAAPC